MTMPRWWWVHPTLFGLALSGLLINLVLHLATFNASDLPVSLGWVRPVFVYASLGSIFVSALRRVSGPRLRVPTPPLSSLFERLRAGFRAAPPFARIIYGLEALLRVYMLFLAIQLITLLGTPKSDGYQLHVWSAIVMGFCFLWTRQAAKALGWWGWWEVQR